MDRWQSAPAGRVKLSPLLPGPLSLEVRVLDPGGQASPTLSRTVIIRPRPVPAPQTIARWQAGKTFVQEVVVSRASAYRILGIDLSQNVQYAFVSSFSIDRVAENGTVQVKQKVQSAHLIQSEPAMQALLQDSLRKTQGATFEMVVGPQGEVTRFRAAQDPIKVLPVASPVGGQAFLLWSFLDEDAWKELAQLTFFQPERPLGRNKTWARPLAHAWGPLGQWRGQTHYTAAGEDGALKRVLYRHDMKYEAPAGTGEGFPFRVIRGDFRPQMAGGVILFDPVRERVTGAEETFRVRGSVVVSAAGNEIPVEMEEGQLFRLRVLDRPAEGKVPLP